MILIWYVYGCLCTEKWVHWKKPLSGINHGCWFAWLYWCQKCVGKVGSEVMIMGFCGKWKFVNNMNGISGMHGVLAVYIIMVMVL